MAALLTTTALLAWRPGGGGAEAELSTTRWFLPSPAQWSSSSGLPGSSARWTHARAASRVRYGEEAREAASWAWSESESG